MTTNNSTGIHRQFLINSLEKLPSKYKLPYDITNNINSYLFYDNEATNVRNEIRMKICNDIKDGFNSRNREKHREMQLEDEYLVVDYGNKCTFSGIYCKKCGENVSVGLTDTRVWCSNCEHQLQTSCYIENENVFDDYLSWRHHTYRHWSYYMERDYVSMLHSGLVIWEE